ncbi:hypothetical protein ACGF0K_31575 [Streptomyces sp. NPDC048156]|uniref:hypothetical protein n=1 Tax=Streptomyces sp. NPDC048156 TaxID=3365502 RepID=UPI003722120A
MRQSALCVRRGPVGLAGGVIGLPHRSQEFLVVLDDLTELALRRGENDFDQCALSRIPHVLHAEVHLALTQLDGLPSQGVRENEVLHDSRGIRETRKVRRTDLGLLEDAHGPALLKPRYRLVGDLRDGDGIVAHLAGDGDVRREAAVDGFGWSATNVTFGAPTAGR